MPRKSMNDLAMEYVLLSSDLSTPDNAFKAYNTYEEMARRVGDKNATKFVERAKETYKLISNT